LNQLFEKITKKKEKYYKFENMEFTEFTELKNKPLRFKKKYS